MEVTLTIDPWTDASGTTETLYPNFIFVSASADEDGHTHGSNCLAPAVYISNNGFSGRLGLNESATVNHSGAFDDDGVEHTYRWEYDKDTQTSTLYKDGAKLSTKVNAASGKFGYLLGAHSGYSSARNFNIKPGYHIKTFKFYIG